MMADIGRWVEVYDTELFTGGHRTVSQVQDPASRREGRQTLTAEQRAHSKHQRRQAGTNNAAMIKYVHRDHNRSTVIRKVRNDGKLGIRSDILPYKYKTLLINNIIPCVSCWSLLPLSSNKRVISANWAGTLRVRRRF